MAFRRSFEDGDEIQKQRFPGIRTSLSPSAPEPSVEEQFLALKAQEPGAAAPPGAKSPMSANPLQSNEPSKAVDDIQAAMAAAGKPHRDLERGYTQEVSNVPVPEQALASRALRANSLKRLLGG